jgi:glycosyltransferase involved in cell wall biosynthesis
MRSQDLTRVLVDLKPAFDGFSGIPQETRLLFSALRRLPGLKTRGLLQLGGNALRAAIPAQQGLQPAQHMHRLAQTVISFSAHPNAGKSFQKKFLRELEMYRLEGRTRRGKLVPTSLFDGRLFVDFLWRTLFDKTLTPAERQLVAEEWFHVVEPSRQHFHRVGLRSLRKLPSPRYPSLDTSGFDFFVAQTPFPGELSEGTRMIVRYHDAVPLFMPHTIKDKGFHLATHYHALQANVRSGAWFSCVSEATRKDLLALFPEAEDRSEVLHNMIAAEYGKQDATPAALVPQLLRNRAAAVADYAVRPAPPADGPLQYLLMVSTLEPRKNHGLLVSAWEALKYAGFANLKLVVVGGLGWDFQPIVRQLRPWVEQGEVFHLENVPARELRVLYSHAAVTVCPSLFEGFDYSGAEALSCGSPVAASDLPVHREIYADGASYFDPYDIADAARTIAELIGTEQAASRPELAGRGRAIAARYLPDEILPRWDALLRRAKTRAGAN